MWMQSPRTSESAAAIISEENRMYRGMLTPRAGLTS